MSAALAAGLAVAWRLVRAIFSPLALLAGAIRRAIVTQGS